MTEYPSYDYVVEIDAPAPATPCKCDDRGWQGPFAALREIEGCSLTPGDPSPAGRCPECETLAYVARPDTTIETMTLEDFNADVSDALDHLEAGQTGDAITVLKGMADWIRERLPTE